MTGEPLDPIALSALQHWCYCPRQCALIHVEQVFEENLFTQRGQALHKRVDDPGCEVRDGLRVERALPLFCDRLGLVGKADVVEFLPDGAPYPVEYKHGSRNKRADIAACDDIQLAAQALCLEEMFGRAVPEGALYYATSRRRRIVAVDAQPGPDLRQRWPGRLPMAKSCAVRMPLRLPAARGGPAGFKCRGGCAGPDPSLPARRPASPCPGPATPR
jgi:CRISPR-associated exonuclease Cas4